MNKFAELKERVVRMVLAAKINAETPSVSVPVPIAREPEK